MPELSFKPQGIEQVPFAAAPMLAIRLRISESLSPGDQPTPIQSVILQCQIRIEPARRRYAPAEKDGLVELFGEPYRWGQTVKSMLWTNVSMIVPSFTGSTTADLQVPCTFDFNVAATKFFKALEEGPIPLCLLFSGTIFYAGEEGALQIEQISWEKEADLQLPVDVWKTMMEQYYPNSAWLRLSRDVIDRLEQYRIRSAARTWEQALQTLLDQAEERVVR